MDLLSFFIGFASDLVADAVKPVKNPRDPEEIVANPRVTDAATLASRAVPRSQATSTTLDPYRRSRSNLVLTGPMERLSRERFEKPSPPPQSILVVWPYLTLLAALTVVCFARLAGVPATVSSRVLSRGLDWMRRRQRSPSVVGGTPFADFVVGLGCRGCVQSVGVPPAGGDWFRDQPIRSRSFAKSGTLNKRVPTNRSTISSFAICDVD